MQKYIYAIIKYRRAYLSVIGIISQNAAYCSTPGPKYPHLSGSEAFSGPQGLDLKPIIAILLVIAVYMVIRYTYGHREIYEVMTKKIQSHSVEEN